MNLFGLSPGELLLIMMVAMVVLGPEKLPEVAASLGKWIREFRRATEELTAQFAGENPLYEIQRALSLTDDPVPVAPAEEVAPATTPAYTDPDVLASVVAPASAPQLSAPIHSDYFNFPQMYPSMSDLWVHGSLPDIVHRNGHATFDVRPIAEEWTFGVPVVRPTPTVEAEPRPETEADTASPADSSASEAVALESEQVAETVLNPESGSDVAPSSAASDEPPVAGGDASTPAHEIPQSQHVAEADSTSPNGVASHRTEETVAIPVHAGAGDSREGERK